MFRYLKTAFTNSWNLLFFFGGLGFAALSGQPDVVIPIVLAAESLYLGALGTHPKFQAYVDAQAAKSNRLAHSERNQDILKKILKLLPVDLYSRYEQLRQRCRNLQQIAVDLRVPGTENEPVNLETMQTEGLDRLLWVFLRLLFTQHSLERFFETISSETLESEQKRLKAQIAKLNPNDQSPHAEKIRHTLNDNLKTLQDRSENFQRAQGNYQFVQLELDRLENKIQSLAELAVNRQDPDFISNQVDAVAKSMLVTEKTMNDLQFVTGLGQVDDDTPELLTEPPIMIH